MDFQLISFPLQERTEKPEKDRKTWERTKYIHRKPRKRIPYGMMNLADVREDDCYADCLHLYASQRDKMKGESFVHGFTLALTALNRFYRPVSEQDTQAGYVDLFLMPRLEVFSDMQHSYILELKYAKSNDSDTLVQHLRSQATVQAIRYAETERVQRSIGHTQLHRIVVVYRGLEMVVCEEV